MSSDKKPNSFVFAAVMCIVTSLALTGTAVGLKDRQTLNIKVDQQKNILKALNLLPEGKLSGEEVQSIYNQSVMNVYVTEEGQLTQSETERPIFVVQDEGKIESYAVPFAAYGLWSWIYGYVALEGDGETVKGLTVYQHAETPGLGGEVEKEWFQKQYIGKKILDSDGDFVSVGVAKGKITESIPVEDHSNYVDGISGATLTSVGMQNYIKSDLEKYEVFASRLRKDNNELN